MKCPRCNNELVQEYNYCDNCGVSLVYEKLWRKENCQSENSGSNSFVDCEQNEFAKTFDNKTVISLQSKNNSAPGVFSRLFLFLFIILILYVVGSFALSILGFIGVVFLGLVFLSLVLGILGAIFK